LELLQRIEVLKLHPYNCDSAALRTQPPEARLWHSEDFTI